MKGNQRVLDVSFMKPESLRSVDPSKRLERARVFVETPKAGLMQVAPVVSRVTLARSFVIVNSHEPQMSPVSIQDLMDTGSTQGLH